MFCSKCGATIAEGATSCAVCGQPTAPGATGGSSPAVTGGMVGTPPPVAYAGFWLRFVALIIDMVILCIVLGIPFGIVMGALGLSVVGRSPEEIAASGFGAIALLELIGLMGQWLYFALMESSSWQATLGKKALGLTVTDLAGQRISFGRASGRYFAKIISSLILLIWYIMAGFTAKKQALHDMIAGCLVWRKL
jgi:uncharacterized RDD family membrane protein YckC